MGEAPMPRKNRHERGAVSRSRPACPARAAGGRGHVAMAGVSDYERWLIDAVLGAPAPPGERPHLDALLDLREDLSRALRIFLAAARQGGEAADTVESDKDVA